MNLENNNGIQGKFRFKVYEAGTDNLLWTSEWQKNLITSVDGYGLNIVMRLLRNENTYSLAITRARIGTDTTPADETQTDLIAPFDYDIPIANRTAIGTKTVLFEFFIPDAFLDEDTYNEFATYCGTQMFSRAIISGGYTKAINTDTRIEYQYTISNV